MSRSLLIAFVALWSACASGRQFAFDDTTAVDTASGRVVTLIDLLATGRRLVDEWVAALPPPQRERFADLEAVAQRSAVRVAVRERLSAFSYAEGKGSGVLVAGLDGARRIVSAGHVFRQGSGESVVKAWTTTGGELAARLDSAVAEGGRGVDLAWLRCEGAVEPAPALASARVGSLVVAYGYPDGCGLDTRGRVVQGKAYEGQPLAPLRLVLTVIDDDPLLFEPVAGSIPLGGFSGGGIFDLDGNVVGVLVAVEWEPRADGVQIRVRGNAVDAAPEPASDR